MHKTLQKKNQPWRGDDTLRTYRDNVIKSAARVWRRCLRGFALWLREERQLALSSVVLRVSSAKQFVEAQKGEGGVRTLKTLGVTDVEDFFIEYGKAHGPYARRSMQAGLRLFLRYAVSRCWVKPLLAEGVPSMRSYRQSTIPRGLDNKSVCALVTAGAEKSARDHAIVLILAVYGVRRGQVSGLRFDDIDWRKREIVFQAHKRGKAVLHELVPSVAEALSKYLRYERPQINNQAVFLRARKPILPLSPSAITQIVRSLIGRVEFKNGMPCGPHTLRHAFATRLLQSGQPLKVIADLLGHRSLDAATIYAKVDHPRLFEVADEWPEVGL